MFMSPRTRDQNEEMRQRSREAIKEAALELFARQGYTHTTVSQIATRAGVSKGLLYNYFDGKEDLLYQIIEEQIELAENMMEQTVREIPDPLRQLETMIEGAIQFVLRDLDQWRLITSLAFQPEVTERLRPLLRRNQETTLAITSEIFRKLGAKDPLKETYLLGAMLDGIVLGYVVLQEDYDLEEMKDYLLRRYIHQNYPRT